jgi:hypothetical protein
MSRFADPRTRQAPQPAPVQTYEQKRDAAASAKITASMELKLHGIPRDREARKRLEAVLGDTRPARVQSDYDVLNR